MKDNGHDLGFSKQAIMEKFEREIKADVPTREPFYAFSNTISAVIRFIIDLGIPLPFWLFVADPRKRNFSRQGVVQLQPQQSVTISFKARQKGHLVLDEIEIAPEDALAFDALRIEFFEKRRENNIDYSEDQGREVGFWKISKKVLFDESVFSIRVTNTDQFGLCVFSLLINGWEN